MFGYLTVSSERVNIRCVEVSSNLEMLVIPSVENPMRGSILKIRVYGERCMEWSHPLPDSPNWD